MHRMTLTIEGGLGDLTRIADLADSCTKVVASSSERIAETQPETQPVKVRTNGRPSSTGQQAPRFTVIQRFQPGDRVLVAFNDATHGVPAKTVGIVRTVNVPKKGSVEVALDGIGVKQMRQSALRLVEAE